MTAIDFSGAHVVVTGGSNGIGNAMARAFRDCGAAVTATGTRARESYDSDLDGMDYAALDLGDDAAIADFAAAIDKLDVLVNCAGMVAYRGREFEAETFRKVMDVNLTAWSPERERLGEAGDDGFGVRYEARAARLAHGNPCCQALD